MFKLAHLSDVHLGPLPEPTWQQLASKRILGYLNWKKNRKHALGGDYLEGLLNYLPTLEADHIVVSGDLVNLALPDEYNNAASFLSSLGTAENVTTVCGNHDAYTKEGMSLAITHWKSYMSADAGLISSTSDYPILRIRDEVAIIGCNSAEATAPFLATGYFRKTQADKLREILNETRQLCRVVCIHHPPHPNATHWHKRLIGDALFREVLAECGAELVLHGHTHLATSHSIPGKGRNIPVICVPAAGNALGGKKPAGRINLFTFDRTGDRFSIHHAAFGYSQIKDTLEQVVDEVI